MYWSISRPMLKAAPQSRDCGGGFWGGFWEAASGARSNQPSMCGGGNNGTEYTDAGVEFFSYGHRTTKARGRRTRGETGYYHLLKARTSRFSRRSAR